MFLRGDVTIRALRKTVGDVLSSQGQTWQRGK